MTISRVILYFFLLTVAIALPPLALQYTGNADLLAKGFWALFIFMSVITFFALMLMLFVKRQNSEYFAQAFLGGTTVKIIFCLGFIFIFLRNNNVNKQVFMANFAYIYLLNMAFEIYVLLRNLRHENLR